MQTAAHTYWYIRYTWEYPLGSGGLVPSLFSVCRHKDRPINAEEDWGNYFVSPFIRPVPNVELLPRRTQMFRFTCRHGYSTPFVTIRSGPGLSPDRGTALCSWAKHFILIVPLGTSEVNAEDNSPSQYKRISL